MTELTSLDAHYTTGGLLDNIRNGVKELGKTAETVTVADLAPVDEFHIGGRAATKEFLSQISIDSEMSVLDIGCGLGGVSRFIATEYGAAVRGIDLTPEFVETGRKLNKWVGLEGKIDLHVGNALQLPFEANGFNRASFDCAVLFHVGMNIEDKTELCRQVHSALKPGGVFAVYDVMCTTGAEMVQQELTYPVPWSSAPEFSFVHSPAHYRTALENASFQVEAERNRRDFAIAFFEKLNKTLAGRSSPPPLGLHLTMGRDVQTKVANMVSNIAAGRIAPVEIIARKNG